LDIGDTSSEVAAGLLLGCCYGDEKVVKPICCVAVYEVEIPSSDGMSMESVVDQEGGLT
jgi:hypothetical protein